MHRLTSRFVWLRAIYNIAQYPSLYAPLRRTKDRLEGISVRLINRAEPEGKSRITLEIKLAATVIKAATTLISTRIGTNRTEGRCVRTFVRD